MRPLALRLSGFRSYRSECTVSFRDLDLVAIIGDTGAGKSSLLEAMTWALYGASTWSRKSSTDLLAHGSKRMSVALDFEAGGEEWRVIRTFARSGGGGAELTCLSNAAIANVDGVRQVEPRIEDLLGLSYDVFCSCVLLPQGKFERLLKATRGERTDTLKSILRLEQLGQARDLADRYAGLVGEREREMLEARGRFRPDPMADVAAAEAELARLQPDLARLETLTEQVNELLERCRDHAARAKDASDAVKAVMKLRGDHVAVLRSVVGRAGALRGELEEARRAVEAASGCMAALEDRHRAAESDGVDIAGLTRHERTIETIRSTATRRDAVARRVAELSREDAETRSALEAAVRDEKAAKSATAAHGEEEDRARASASVTAERLTAAKAAASALEAAAKAEKAAAAALEQACAAVAQRRTLHAELERRLAAATAERDQTLAARENATREEAAAHLAADCAAGDPCPVCSRTLPADFSPPAAPLLDAAIQAADAAAVALDVVAAGEREAALELRTATHNSATAENTLREEEHARHLAEREVTPIDEAEARAADARAELEALLEEGKVKAAAVAGCGATKARLETQVAGAAKSLTERERESSTIAAELASAMETLPGYCALEAAALTPAAIDEAAAAVAERLEAARALERERVDAAAVATSAEKELNRLVLAWQKEVVTPSATVRAALALLHAELRAEAGQELPLPNPETAPAPLLEFADALVARADVHVADLRASAADALAARERDQEEGRRLIEEAGFNDSRALAARFDELRGRSFAAETERKRAAAQIEGAALIDQLLGRARELRAGFEALKEVLADRAFVGYVVARRQRALLIHASKVLDDITGRYAFTDDFRILDRESGLPRSPDTLSGGETFIASLALALGLVEVADRSGGDLRALFLDEGFGTLDAAILETAISALEERAKSGRLIGVISHVPTVAERIDTVLEVRHGIDGSSVAVLSVDERERRVTDGAEAVAAAL